MPTCANPKYVGRDVAIEYFIGCGDTKPDSGDYIPVGAFTSKELTIEWDQVDPTADDSVGNLKETLATYLNFSLSGDLVARSADVVGVTNQIALIKHVANPVATGGQPFAWMTYECFMLISNISVSAPTTDVVTRSFEAAAASSPFGLIITDTPVVP
jgi:hypothetical protein